MRNVFKTAGAALATLFLVAGCDSASSDTDRVVIDSENVFAAAIGTPQAAEVCALIADVPTAVDTDDLTVAALASFEEGYGQSLSATDTFLFAAFVEECR